MITLLQTEFKLRDLGSVYFFLGIEVKPNVMGILLSQHNYALDIIHQVGMTSYKSIDTPLSNSSKLEIMLGTLHSDSTRYRQIIRALQYLTFTRPDISMQSTRYVNLCIPLLRIIGLSLNVSCVTSRLQKPMVCTLPGTLS